MITIKDKSVIEVVTKIQESRSNLSRYTVTTTLKSGLDLKGKFETAENGGKFVTIDVGLERKERVFLRNGQEDDKKSYDLAIAEANGEFTYQGIKYPKGHQKLVLV